MKTLFTKQQHSSRALALTLSVVAALGTAGLLAAPAQADIVARGRIGGADIRVRLETPDRVIVHAPAPRVVVRHPAPIDASIRWGQLDRDDHRIAARLSLLSGVGERRLLAQRSHGWGWKRIAKFHGIPHRVLAQARSHRALQPVGHVCYDRYDHDHDDDDDDDRRDRDDRRRGRRDGRG